MLCAWRQDDINLERHQFGCSRGERFQLPLCIPIFDHYVAALDLPKVTQSLTESLVQADRTIARQIARQVAYSRDLDRLLRFCGERHSEDAPAHHGEERAPVHH